MSHIPPEDTSGTPGPTRPSGAGRGPLVAASVAVVGLVGVAIVMVVGAMGDDGEEDDTQAIGSAVATASTEATLPSNAGTVATTAATTSPDSADGGGSPAGADLPAVTIPAESSPPTTIPGSEPNSIPTDIMSGEEAPQWGTLVVDLDEGGYLDFPVHLRTDQELSLLSMADDGIRTEIEVFAPDGSSEGSWEGGEPGVVNGLEWYLPEEPLPATGTYVIRVIHTGGSHEPFALGFFGNA
ncbi:MAG TPA: hypothetical protein VFY82_10325 [Acidimicrobiales bacterium]|nr:hypothetical protein [Acidimicrobiales bacterium]